MDMEDVWSTWHWHWSFKTELKVNLLFTIKTLDIESFESKAFRGTDIETPSLLHHKSLWEWHGIAAPQDGGSNVHRQCLASSRHSNDHHRDSAFLAERWVPPCFPIWVSDKESTILHRKCFWTRYKSFVAIPELILIPCKVTQRVTNHCWSLALNWCCSTFTFISITNLR